MAFGKERDDAFMADALRILVQSMMQFRGSRHGRGGKPKDQHQTDDQNSANPALTIYGQANPHVALSNTTPRLMQAFFTRTIGDQPHCAAALQPLCCARMSGSTPSTGCRSD